MDHPQYLDASNAWGYPENDKKRRLADDKFPCRSLAPWSAKLRVKFQKLYLSFNSVALCYGSSNVVLSDITHVTIELINPWRSQTIFKTYAPALFC